jgi:hypothetical protein
MARFQRFVITTAALAVVCSSLPSLGADPLTFTGKARVGGEYQSNVNISALEQASDRADNATLLEAELTASWQASQKLKLDAGYSIQDKNYREADDFNTRLQLAYLDGSYQLGKHAVGANIYHANAQLDNTAFLTLNQASFYSMYIGGDSWFIRPSLTLADKTFARNTERDATTLSASADAFWFSASGTRFMSMGLVWEDEESRDQAFSYTSPGIRLKVSNSFTSWQYQQQLQVGIKLSQRDYQKPGSTDQQQAKRSDSHVAIEASWQLNVNKHLAVIGKLEHGNFSSTLASADYRETRSALLLQLGF